MVSWGLSTVSLDSLSFHQYRRVTLKLAIIGLPGKELTQQAIELLSHFIQGKVLPNAFLGA